MNPAARLSRFYDACFGDMLYVRMYSIRSAVEIKGEVRNFGDLFRPGIAGVPPNFWVETRLEFGARM
jgi:hypothetical protein